MGISPAELGRPEAIPPIDVKDAAARLQVGEPTLRDIIEEFKKPARDPREALDKPIFKKGVLHIEDLKEGLELMGVVRNVVDFGAFVDIGVHQDGLVHISELSDKFVRHPLEAVQVGDVVKVRVLGVDMKRKRVSLTMKGAKNSAI
jgi:protein Tex